MVIKIREDLKTEIEALQYEVESRKQVIAYLIFSNSSVKNEAFSEYEKEYLEYIKKYEAKKRELEKEYILPLNIKSMSSWNLDFATGEVTIEEH